MPLLAVGELCIICGETVPDLDKHLSTTSASSNCEFDNSDYLYGENYFEDEFDESPGDDDE